MMAKLPFNSFVKICLYIHPLKCDETNALGGTSNLTLQASNALNNELPMFFLVYIIFDFQKMFVTK